MPPLPPDVERLETKLGENASKELGDPSLPGPRLLEEKLEGEISVEANGLSCNLGGEVVIDLFNSPDDADSMALFSGKTPGRRRALSVQSPLVFSPASAWVAYRVKGTVAPFGGFKRRRVGRAEAKAEVAASVCLHSYRRHSSTANLGAAIRTDTRNPRFAFSAPDVKDLRPGEALALEVEGSLEASLTLTWADVLTSHLGALARLVREGEDITFRLGARARVKVAVDIHDHFLLVFSRARVTGGLEPEETIRFAVKTTDRRAFEAAAAARVGVRIADAGATQEILSSVLDGLLGVELPRAMEIANATDLSELRPDQHLVAERLMDRLGLGGGSTLQDLRERIQKLEEKARQTLECIAEAKVALAVEIEYSRVGLHESFIEGILNETVLGEGFAEAHGALVRGEFGRVADLEGVVLTRFLEERTTKTIRSLGVTFDVGDLIAVGGKSRDYVRETIRYDRLTHRSRYSFTDSDSYRSRWGRNTAEWKAALTARSRRWTVGDRPIVPDLKFTLELAMSYQERQVSESDIYRFVDLGLLWGIVTPGGASDVRDRLRHISAAQRDVAVSFRLWFPDILFDVIFGLVAQADSWEYGQALALALPFVDDERGRATPSIRRKIYANAWKRYLDEDDLTGADLARVVEETCRRAGYGALGGQEGRKKHWWTVAEIATHNPDTRKRFTDLKKGMSQLGEAVLAGAHFSEVGKSAGLLSRGWEHQLHLRALGAWLVRIFRGHEHLWSAVNRSMRVEYEDSTGSDRSVTLVTS